MSLKILRAALRNKQLRNDWPQLATEIEQAIKNHSTALFRVNQDFEIWGAPERGHEFALANARRQLDRLACAL